MQQTTHYALNKPDPNDSYNKANDNANMDTIDAQMYANAQAASAAQTAADNAQSTANAAQTAANNAQSAADAAQNTANAALPASSYTASDVLTKLKTVDGKGSGLDADTVQGVDVVSQTANYNMTTSNPDSNGYYTVTTYTRPGGNTYMVSTLSGTPDSFGNYPTMTNVFYKADGATVDHTDTWTLTFDSNGKKTGESVVTS
ncbi:hypothetical protein [Alicyclobacillus fastidiosus]|uniref:Uncharacterized protein n=1 Tax=Alicyclobacillus fastidiosus TaxID=392011 RepID=A0ABV5AKJ7_9BACL|nr:hypothetical protein [Alicyclobacillus fastidiosus]WEH08175.1 hypothetical protein PYS47_15830 [Alicyclobacillus fastidiosus]